MSLKDINFKMNPKVSFKRSKLICSFKITFQMENYQNLSTFQMTLITDGIEKYVLLVRVYIKSGKVDCLKQLGVESNAEGLFVIPSNMRGRHSCRE